MARRSRKRAAKKRSGQPRGPVPAPAEDASPDLPLPYEFRDIPENLKADLFAGLLETAIVNGEIDPAGKSEEQLQHEFRAYLEHLASFGDRLELRVGLDHREDLLREARRYVAKERDELACLLYMTWCEHWINYVVMVGCKRAGLNDEETMQVLRQVSLPAKLSWLMPLLGLRRIHPPHQRAVQRLAELRNAFVHYKWKMHTDEDWERSETEVRAALDPIDATIRYLRQYERKYVLAETMPAVRRFARGKAASR